MVEDGLNLTLDIEWRFGIDDSPHGLLEGGRNVPGIQPTSGLG